MSAALARFSREVSSLVNGTLGERRLARALGWLTCPNEVLLNVELEHDGERCEYDAIVITPAGIDIVESKFFNYHAVIDSDGFFHDRARSRERSYNVGEKIRAKEHVLFSVIDSTIPGAIPRSCVRSILFVANNNAVVKDRFGLVDVYNSGQICPLIEGRKGGAIDWEVSSNVADAVEGARQSFLYEPPLDFEQLRSDIADFIVMTERAAARSDATSAHAIEVDSPTESGFAIDRHARVPEIAQDVAAVILSALGAGATGYGLYRLSRWAA